MNALARYTPRAPQDALTVFAAFLAALDSLVPVEARTHFGEAQWSRFLRPRRVVASGLWVVKIRVAKDMRLELFTREDHQQVERVIGRLVSCGIIIRFGSTDLAAYTFVQDVLETLNSAIRAGYRPGMKLSADAWSALRSGSSNRAEREISSQRQQTSMKASIASFVGLLCAIFFMDLIGACQKLRKEMHNVITALHQDNVIRVGREQYYVDDASSLEPLEALPRALSLMCTNVNMAPEDIPGLVARTRELQAKLAALKRIHVPFQDIPESILAYYAQGNLENASRIGLVASFLRTQIYLAAIGEMTGRVVLIGRQYARAIRAVQKAGPKKTKDATAQRLVRHGWADHPDDAIAALELILQEHNLGHIKAVIDHMTVTFVLLDLDRDSSAMTSRAALALLMDPLKFEAERIQEDPEKAAKMLFGSVDWTRVSEEEFSRVVQDDILPDLLVRRAAEKLRPEFRANARQLLREQGIIAEGKKRKNKTRPASVT